MEVFKIVNFTIEGKSPYQQSKAIPDTRSTGEGHDDYEKRVWRQRMHFDSKGEVFIPPMAIKLCLADCAQFLGESVPGKRGATYTKHFDAGVMVQEPVMLGIQAEDVPGETLFVPSDGRKGGGKRVFKTFPRMPEWGGSGQLILLDPLLIANLELVHRYFVHAGNFIGLGFFRPRKGGYCGRFNVTAFEAD